MSLRTAFALGICVAGLVAAANIFYPQIGNRILGAFQKKETSTENSIEKKAQDILTDILGEETKTGITQEEIFEELKTLGEKIYSQEIVKETTEKINQVVTEKIETTKDLPEQALEEAKKEVKKDICEQVCGEWITLPSPSSN